MISSNSFSVPSVDCSAALEGGQEEEDAIDLRYASFFLFSSWKKFIAVRFKNVASSKALFSKLFKKLFSF